MSTKYIIFLIIVLGIAFVVYLIKNLDNKDRKGKDLSVYEKKPFLFDAKSELDLYRILLELFGDKYFIFPQVNYSHLIQPKKTNWADKRKYRSSIDRKSADFVICDKEHIIPRLVIELDGYVHNFKKKQERDIFINELTKITDLPLLHIKTGNFDKEFIKKEVFQKLK